MTGVYEFDVEVAGDVASDDGGLAGEPVDVVGAGEEATALPPDGVFDVSWDEDAGRWVVVVDESGGWDGHGCPDERCDGAADAIVEFSVGAGSDDRLDHVAQGW